MSKKFEEMLLNLRKEAGFTQTQLGDFISRDASTISRLENGKSSPNPEIVRDIISALSLKGGIERDELDSLWDAADYNQKPPDIDPGVTRILHQLAGLREEEKTVVIADMRSVIELNKEFFRALKISDNRMWKDSIDVLEPLRDDVDQLLQEWYLRIDREMARCYYSSVSFGNSLRYYEWALINADRLKDKESRGDILVKIGNVHRRRGGNNCKKALDYYRQGEEIFRELSDDIRVTDCIRKQAGAKLFQGYPKQALYLCDSAMEKSKKLGYLEGEYKTLQHMAWANSALGDWNKGIEQCEDALDMVPADNKWDRFKALRYLGDAYRVGKRYEDAKRVCEEGKSLFIEIGTGESRTYGLTLLGLSKVLFEGEKGQEKEALKTLEKGYKAHGNAGDDFRAIDFRVTRGKIAARMGDKEYAEKVLILAAKQYKDIEQVSLHMSIVALLCDLYCSIGSYQEVNRIVRDLDNVDEKDRSLAYSLAQTKLSLGTAMLYQRNSFPLQNVADSWVQALDKALDFNTFTFDDITDQIIEIIRGFSESATTKDTIDLCDYFKASWDEYTASWDEYKKRGKREDIDRMLKKMADLRTTIEWTSENSFSL